MPLPARPEELTPTRLTDLMRPRLTGRVTSVRVDETFGSAAVTSTVSRLILTVDGDPHFPRSIVAKSPNPAWTYGDDPHRREDRFYRRIANSLGRSAPECFFSAVDDDGRFLLLLEDLSTRRPGPIPGGWSTLQAGNVLDTLAAMHRPQLLEGSPLLEGLPVRRHGLDEIEKMKARWSEFGPRLLRGKTYPVTPSLRSVAASIPAWLDRAFELDEGLRVLSHSDIHVDNVVFDADRAVLLDWQSAHVASPAHDVAGVVAVSTDPHAQRDALQLVDRYADATSLERSRLRAQVRLAVAWTFVGIGRWLVRFDEERLREPATLQKHWLRLHTALRFWLGDNPSDQALE